MNSAVCIAEPRRSSRKGFTLVELLVVIGVIAVLVSILLPALGSVREQGLGVVCQNNERMLWKGFTLFAMDHDNRLPGSYVDSYVSSTPPDERDWVGNPNGVGQYLAPRAGTIFKYVRNEQAYHCPSIEPGSPSSDIWQNVNLRFDYAAFTTWSGVHIEKIPALTQVHHSTGVVDDIPTPILGEYTGMFWGGVAAGNQMSHAHHGGSYYVSADGAAIR